MPPNRPEIIPELATAPAPAKLMPHPPADETAPLFVILQAVLAAPSMPSAAPVEVMVPVLVTIRGSSDLQNQRAVDRADYLSGHVSLPVAVSRLL